MNIAKHTIVLMIGVCLGLCFRTEAKAATAPQYQFYSTSMLSPNRQSNYAPSHINQSGSVRVAGGNNGNHVMRFDGNKGAGSARVFSVKAFTQPGRVYIAGVGGNGGGWRIMNGGSSNSGRSISYTGGGSVISLPALKIQRQNAEVVVAAAATHGDTDQRPRRVNAVDDPDADGAWQPIGDAILPLMLMAMIYATICFMRRKKRYNLIGLMVLVLALGSCTHQPSKCYSREMINARMSAWYNKDNCVGFPNVNSTNGVIMPEHMATWDYVPGVVAKGILDVWQYYQDSAWADAWYIGLAEWADQLDEEELNELVRGGILDDLNCAKVFMGLYEGAKPGGKFENADRAAYYMQQMQRAARGLDEHAAKYSIHTGIGGDGETLEPEVEGGWMHKATGNPEKSYWGQMWCDGAYMGPALLAQLLQYGACEGTRLGWNDVVKQFTASWPYLWNEEKQLPYHVLFTDVEINKNARAIHDSGHAFLCNQPSAISHQQLEMTNYLFPVYHSEEYWGRAAGWYILALVDVMEAYMKGLSDEEQSANELPQAADFETLHDYLTKLANGLIARQDKATGCWYQLLQYGSEKCATQGIDDTGSKKYTNVAEGGTQCNYLESSATCLITAALLKATRLGFGDYAEAGRRGFEGIQKQFIQTIPASNSLPAGEGRGRASSSLLTITSSCQSAGLSHDRNGSAAYYLIGKDVPIQDNTEGKVLGAYLMAAVEYERACQR